MKRALVLATVLILAGLLVGCGSKDEYKRNEKYTYGTYASIEEIQAAYPLTGTATSIVISDYTSGVQFGSKGSYLITVSATKNGGVIAYGEDLYIYSSDKADKEDVEKALMQELIYINKNK